MFRKFILTLIFCSFITASYAVVVSEETSDGDFLYKRGHSAEVVRMVEQNKERIEAKKKPKRPNMIVRCIKHLYGYINPEVDTDKFGDRVVRDDKFQ